jgi:hypothetical protein
MAVVVLLGLLASATAWSMIQQARQASLTHVISGLSNADQMARLSSRRLGRPCMLVINLESQTLQRLDLREDQNPTAGHTWRVPSGHSIEQVSIARGADSADAIARSFTAGTVEIPFSIGGRSPTYALKLKAPPRSTADSAPGQTPAEHWLVFSGLAGQMTELHDATHVDNLFTLLAIGRPDAD